MLMIMSVVMGKYNLKFGLLIIISPGKCPKGILTIYCQNRPMKTIKMPRYIIILFIQT